MSRVDRIEEARQYYNGKHPESAEDDIDFLISEVRLLEAERDEARALAVELANLIEEADQHIAWESASPFIGRQFQDNVERILSDRRLAKIRGEAK